MRLEPGLAGIGGAGTLCTNETGPIPRPAAESGMFTLAQARQRSNLHRHNPRCVSLILGVSSSPKSGNPYAKAKFPM